MANDLGYYQEIVKQMIADGKLKGTAKQIKEYTQQQYEYDPASDFKGVRPQAAPLPPGSAGGLKPINTGPRTDWDSFVNGKIIYNAGTANAAGVNTEAFITLPQTDTKQPPVRMALLPSADGTSFQLIDLNTAAAQFRAIIPNTAADYKYYKTQLSAYYPGGAKGQAFQNSLAQPITENDLGFEEAIKKAINTVSLDNFNKAQRYAKKESTAPELQGYERFVQTRNLLPGTSRQRQSTSSLTTEMDAKAEFRRTVQQYVGNPELVDKVDKLADSYWKKLHAEELRRISYSSSITDPLGLTTNTTGVSYAPLSEQDRIEMRLNFIVKGDKKIESVGLKNASQEDLEEAGAVIGASYGKLNKIAADYGVQLTHEDLLERVNRAIKPGGVTAGVSPDSMNTGLTAEENSIKTSAKIRFKALAPYIDQGLKVSDISSNFQRLKEKEYGLADNSINIYDDDVMKAISGDGIATTNDFLLGVRSNPAWRKTPKANEMAAEFLNTILKSWGKVG